MKTAEPQAPLTMFEKGEIEMVRSLLYSVVSANEIAALNAATLADFLRNHASKRVKERFEGLGERVKETVEAKGMWKRIEIMASIVMEYFDEKR